MVANVHSIFSHTLVGFFIHIVGEGNEILFRKSHRRYSKVGGVEFLHVSDRSVPLVERVPGLNN